MRVARVRSAKVLGATRYGCAYICIALPATRLVGLAEHVQQRVAAGTCSQSHGSKELCRFLWISMNLWGCGVGGLQTCCAGINRPADAGGGIVYRSRVRAYCCGCYRRGGLVHSGDGAIAAA